ncbi:hypothetical protein JCM10908_003446 [Rhodotorula pacifica]|uniref:uncharacterized protein n=1 Tax=Rhodotorula pacifica TaxID=1495444 RepID=UPI0031776617
MESVTQRQPYSPFVPSPLSSSASASAFSSPPPPQHPLYAMHHDDETDALSSDPMLPSSPTPKSVSERAKPRLHAPPPPPGRAASYKSRVSTRRIYPGSANTTSSSSPAMLSSSPTSLSSQTRRAAQENSRVARMQYLRRHSSRDVPLVGQFVGPDEPGGWVDGEWEEFDEEEKMRLELEMKKAKKEFEWRQRRLDELASEQGFLPEEEEEELTAEDQDMEEEPPLDVLLDDDPPPPSPSHFAGIPYVPDVDSAPNAESTTSNPLSRHSPAQASARASSAPSSSPSNDDLAAFDAALISSPFCPACGATNSPLGGHSTVGLRCTGSDGQSGCGWGIEMSVLAPLRAAFAAHGSYREGHRPLLSYTPFTGTIVLCAVPDCDEQYGV